jgi:hypothetical protein
MVLMAAGNSRKIRALANRAALKSRSSERASTKPLMTKNATTAPNPLPMALIAFRPTSSKTPRGCAVNQDMVTCINATVSAAIPRKASMRGRNCR